jgi:hypothetical protein
MTPRRAAALFAAVLLAASAAAVSGFHLGGDESGLVQGVLAALRERAEAEEAARFAVAHHNKNQVRLTSRVDSRHQFLRRCELLCMSELH